MVGLMKGWMYRWKEGLIRWMDGWDRWMDRGIYIWKEGWI